jgi:hypothetical protein
MNNWKDIFLLIATALSLLLGADRGYQLATAPAEEAQPTSYAVELNPDRDIRNTRYEILVTYEVAREITAPAGLPGGYTTTQLYTWPQPIVLFLRRPPTPEDVSYIPPALEGSQAEVKSILIISERRPVIDDAPVEKEPNPTE